MEDVECSVGANFFRVMASDAMRWNEPEPAGQGRAGQGTRAVQGRSSYERPRDCGEAPEVGT